MVCLEFGRVYLESTWEKLTIQMGIAQIGIWPNPRGQTGTGGYIYSADFGQNLDNSNFNRFIEYFVKD